jgi:hypothetical protein
VKRTELLRKIRREARRQDVSWATDGSGARHEAWWLGAVKIPVPRHAEISERTAQDILHECEAELGKGWWRR